MLIKENIFKNEYFSHMNITEWIFHSLCFFNGIKYSKLDSEADYNESGE